MSERPEVLKRLAAAQWRLALGLTAAMMAVYFGFILLVAFAKPLLGTLLRPGLSLGTLLGTDSGRLATLSLPLELVLIPALLVLAVAVGFWPAVSAYRTDVAKSLGK